MKRKLQWCIEPKDKYKHPIDHKCHWARERGKGIPKHVRCPRCNRRLIPLAVDTEPEMGGDYHIYFPPHKTRKNIKETI
jgi:hypothetical protein